MKKTKKKISVVLAIIATITMITATVCAARPATRIDDPTIYQQQTTNVKYAITDYGNKHSIYISSCGVGTFRVYHAPLTTENIQELNKLASYFRIPERFRLENGKIVIYKP